MNQRSVGMQRIVTLISFLSALAWILFVFFDSNGFSQMSCSLDWMVLIVGILFTFLVPHLVAKILYWVKDGFNQDKIT